VFFGELVSHCFVLQSLNLVIFWKMILAQAMVIARARKDLTYKQYQNVANEINKRMLKKE